MLWECFLELVEHGNYERKEEKLQRLEIVETVVMMISIQFDWFHKEEWAKNSRCSKRAETYLQKFKAECGSQEG